MQTVILCGGLATRLGDIAKNVPKSMVEINGKPFPIGGEFVLISGEILKNSDKSLNIY